MASTAVIFRPAWMRFCLRWCMVLMSLTSSWQSLDFMQSLYICSVILSFVMTNSGISGIVPISRSASVRSRTLRMV